MACRTGLSDGLAIRPTTRCDTRNTVKGYTGTVSFSSGDPCGATLPADYTFQPNDQGTATFPDGATPYPPGTCDVTATDTTSGIKGQG